MVYSARSVMLTRLPGKPLVGYSATRLFTARMVELIIVATAAAAAEAEEGRAPDHQSGQNDWRRKMRISTTP